MGTMLMSSSSTDTKPVPCSIVQETCRKQHHTHTLYYMLLHVITCIHTCTYVYAPVGAPSPEQLNSIFCPHPMSYSTAPACMQGVKCLRTYVHATVDNYSQGYDYRYMHRGEYVQYVRMYIRVAHNSFQDMRNT